MRNLILTAALAVSIAVPALAGNWAIAVPDTLPEGGQDLKEEGWRFFLREMGPGDALAVLNATEPGQIAALTIPDENKYSRAKWRAKTFARENRLIAAHLDQMAEGAPVTDVIGLLRYVALTRLDPAQPLDLMVVGSAVQIFDDWPDLSMRREDAIHVPSPEHLTASVSETAYGMGAEGADGLQNVYLHLCPVADDLRSDEEAALQGLYAEYLAARGGTLVTWSDDLPTCFKRFAAELRDPIEVEAYAEPEGALTMVKVGAPDVVIEPEPTEVIVNGIKVERFNIFSSASHPTLFAVDVTTGVVYEPGNYPDVYEKAYCYFTVARDGSNLRFDLGEQRPGRDPDWERASDRSLTAAGITRSAFEAGRSACQWPTS